MPTVEEERKHFGAFLRARRAQVSPGSVGLPAVGHPRRVKGLRREEVAALASISGDYYTRLEQGRLPAPSDQVLSAISHALCLDRDEDRYLRVAAERTRGSDRTAEPGHGASPGLLVLLAHLDSLPAIVVDPSMDVLAWNELASLFLTDFSKLPVAERNIVRLLYLNDDVRSRFKDWPSAARTGVSMLRMGVASGIDDARRRELVAELSEADPLFRETWEAQSVASGSHGLRTYVHPVAGELRLEWQSLSSTTDLRNKVMVLTPPADGSADAGMGRLRVAAR